MSLFKSAATISGLTFLSRITGLARDIIIARAFGASALTDAFWVAFRIPNLLRRLFAEGAFSQAFVPILGAYKEQYEEEEVKHLIDHVTLILGATLLLVSLLGALFAPLIVSIMASGIARDGGQPFEAAVFPDDSRHVPLYFLHVFSGLSFRGFKYVAQICHTGFYTDTIEFINDRCRYIFSRSI
ncbi:lipid II flippase MurJ [Oligella ureolytica]